MTVCDGCGQLMDGLADHCPDCIHDMKELGWDTDCWKCKGAGEIEWDDDACSNGEMIMCPFCRGTGENP